MFQATTYSFEAKIAPRGYHVYENTTWFNAKERNEVQVQIKTNPYACALCVKGKYFDVTKTFDIYQEKYFDMYVSLLRKKGLITGTFLSVKYRPSAYRLEILLIVRLIALNQELF